MLYIQFITNKQENRITMSSTISPFNSNKMQRLEPPFLPSFGRAKPIFNITVLRDAVFECLPCRDVVRLAGINRTFRHFSDADLRAYARSLLKREFDPFKCLDLARAIYKAEFSNALENIEKMSHVAEIFFAHFPPHPKNISLHRMSENPVYYSVDTDESSAFVSQFIRNIPGNHLAEVQRFIDLCLGPLSVDMICSLQEHSSNITKIDISYLFPLNEKENTCRKGLLSLIEKSPKLNSFLYYHDRHQISLVDKQTLLALATHSTMLQELALENIYVTTADIKALSQAKLPLRELTLKCCGITDESAIAISFDALQLLNLEESYLSDRSVVHLAQRLPNLKSLNIKYSEITDASINAIAENCTSLEFICLYRSGSLNKSTLINLIFRTQLTKLSFDDEPGQPDFVNDSDEEYYFMLADLTIILFYLRELNLPRNEEAVERRRLDEARYIPVTEKGKKHQNKLTELGEEHLTQAVRELKSNIGELKYTDRILLGGFVSQLARSYAESPFEWGMKHMWENIPRLIDAFDLLSNDSQKNRLKDKFLLSIYNSLRKKGSHANRN